MSGCPFATMSISSVFGLIAGFMLIFAPRPIQGSSATSSDGSADNSRIEVRSNGEMWFTESAEFWPGQAQTIKVDSIIYQGKSEFQEILLFTSEKFGKVLVLDGAIQYTTMDQSSYQEMMAHTPMQLLPSGSVKEVLVIGGGDGGVLRELNKYPEIEKIHICEIDGQVIQVCKDHLPEAACGYKDPRVVEHVEEGFGFLERMKAEGKKFDVIVSDLSDPIGPAESIYQDKFIQLLSEVLNDDHGVASLQGENFWLHEKLIQELMLKAKTEFPVVRYANIAIPTYPNGGIGMMIMCKNSGMNPSVPVRGVGEIDTLLEYYTEDLHAAQFVLPKLQYKKVYGASK